MSSPLDSATYPPPPPPPPFPILTSDISGDLSPPPTSSSFSPSLLIIAAILAAVCLTSAAIHFLLRFPYRPSSSSASSTSSLPPLIRSTSQAYECAGSGSGPSTSSDCAVCLSRFRPGDELRLLPACRHAFHSPCIDTWLRSPAASCPLCRSPVHLPSPPPRPPIAEVEGSQRAWLKNYVDRLVSSDSSRRFSARWIRRIDGTGNLDASAVGTSGAHHASRWTTDPVAVP
ncbi:RING-H2 finger protein ATL46-like [Zingiber officinale]|uniref:RING-type domain-containing protein n=1 Tax=Zingiber officinale TaxID=94328 RepID=A0A8J5GUX1_ZINOF|nr:RING-H2 finger protein ATL46-like [Zingiber officinale]KAG6512018.1 hypothetical protein ZIOFF_030109 [Zingiber officinale]